MAGPDFTFAPEEVSLPKTPQERARLSRERAGEVAEHLEKAAPKFDLARFKREFLPALMRAYNAEARKQGLPLANRNWFRVAPVPERSWVGGVLVKDFYEKNRAKLIPILYAGQPRDKAEKAYDLLLKKMRGMPPVTVWSVPSGSTVGHELGHAKTYYEQPEIPLAALKGKERPPVASVINEAVASWQGFRTAWKAWGRFGIPRKAWGAWFGFPYAAGKLTAAQLNTVLERLKALDKRYPGIHDQATKALYEYYKYVEPVMYNVPGADWTVKEKAALKRFVESRGGKYRENLPADAEKRLRHMKRQPYVMREEEAPSRVASAFPLSIREAGEVVPFPSEKVTPPEEKEKPAEVLSPALEAGSFVLFVKGFPVGWYDRLHSAARAAKEMADAFIEGRPSLLGEAVHRDAPDEIVDWMTKKQADITEPADIFLTDPRYRGTRERVAPMMLSVMSVGGSPPSPEQRSEGVPAGNLFELEDRFLPVAEEAQDRLDWDRIAWATDAVNADIWKIVQEGIAGLE